MNRNQNAGPALQQLTVLYNRTPSEQKCESRLVVKQVRTLLWSQPCVHSRLVSKIYHRCLQELSYFNDKIIYSRKPVVRGSKLWGTKVSAIS